MEQLTMEDVEKLLGKIVLANHMNEQRMLAHIEVLQQELAEYKKDTDEPLKEV